MCCLFLFEIVFIIYDPCQAYIPNFNPPLPPLIFYIKGVKWPSVFFSQWRGFWFLQWPDDSNKSKTLERQVGILRNITLVCFELPLYMLQFFFCFSFVLNSLAYNTIPKNNGKIKTNWKKKLTTTYVWLSGLEQH